MKLVLVDDHRIIIEGISVLLDGHHDVLAIFSDPKQSLNFLKQKPVDILITDYEMPSLNGIDLFKAAREFNPLLRGVLLTMHDEAIVLKRALKEGFHGFLLKNVSKTELHQALDKIVQGHTYVSAELTQKLLMVNQEGIVLSERERQVLQLIIKEYTNKQIADTLFLSERTVETYRKNLFRKANTNNIVGLIKFAYANKLVS
jgi:two-component system, NarL family, nitrate/nitrite response regulator NarL